MKLKGKVALVTGGGTGIGRAASLCLAREGASVAINFSRSSAEAAKTAAEVQACGVSGSAVQADVSSDKQVRAMVLQVQKEYGRIDILVNNAGMTRFIPHPNLEAMEEEIWDRTFAVNLKGAFFCCRAVAPLMKSQGSGRIINIASVAGLTGQGSSIAYCASKAALICMTKSLARVLGPEIGVNAVAPGLIDTRWLEGGSDPNGMRERYKSNSVLKRVGTPEDIAQVVLSLASEHSFMTGQVVVVDGGISL
jgi:3-oxoacyl-[acyl-carrier protein] reductase